MNISISNRVTPAADHSYQQFNPKVKLNIPVKVQKMVKRNMAMQAKKAHQSILPQDILSVREMATLQALFSNAANSQAFYGGTRVKNIQAGFLLDLKG